MCHMKEQHPAFLACMAPSKSAPAPWLKKTPTRCLIPMVRAVDCFRSAQDATTGGISNACAIGPCGFCFLGFYGATVAWCNAWAQETADSLRASDDQGCPRLLQLAGGHDQRRPASAMFHSAWMSTFLLSGAVIWRTNHFPAARMPIGALPLFLLHATCGHSAAPGSQSLVGTAAARAARVAVAFSTAGPLRSASRRLLSLADSLLAAKSRTPSGLGKGIILEYKLAYLLK